MKYLKSLQIMEPMKYNDSTDTESTYFGRSRDFWNNFTGMLNKCGNFEVAFSVEDSHAFFIHASIYITAKDRGLTMMDLALDWLIQLINVQCTIVHEIHTIILN